jgi:hypothetical protein
VFKARFDGAGFPQGFMREMRCDGPQPCPRDGRWPRHRKPREAPFRIAFLASQCCSDEKFAFPPSFAGRSAPHGCDRSKPKPERGHMTEEGSETFVPDANQITAQARKNRRNAQARTRHLQAESLGMQRQCLICGYWTERWLLTGKSSAVAEGSFPHSKSASRKRTLLVRDIC